MDISPDTIIGLGAFACSIGAVAVMHGWRKLHAQQEMQEQLHMQAVQDLQSKSEHLRGELGKANTADSSNAIAVFNDKILQALAKLRRHPSPTC
jgi:hypothetical protein